MVNAGYNDAGCDRVVEVHDGEILRYAPSVVAETVDGADGRDIVERYQCGELAMARKELLGAARAFFDCGVLLRTESFQLHD